MDSARVSSSLNGSSCNSSIQSSAGMRAGAGSVSVLVRFSGEGAGSIDSSMALAKPAREKCSLAFKAFSCRVVPNHVIRPEYFLFEIELRTDDPFCELIIQPSLFTQPCPLRARRAADNDHPLKMSFGRRFVKQRNINEKPAPGRGTLRRFRRPLPTDGRVQDGLKLAAFGVVCKY